MPDFPTIAIGGMLLFIVSALLITQSRKPVAWTAWLVPVLLVLPVTAWSVFAILREGPFGFLASQTASLWGMLVWFNLLLAQGAAFFLLQNRARAAGMKSEVWVLAVALTAGVGLMAMLATTLYLDRRARRDRVTE
jgi:hypothetical protein